MIVYPTLIPPLSSSPKQWKACYELLCNAISDERGKPRVISCLMATLRLTPPSRVQRSKQNKANTIPPLLPVNPWRYEQYKEREENLTEFTLA